MFENATSLTLQPGALDQAVLILRAYVVPILRRQPGLLGLAVVPNQAANQVAVISLWDSPDCARAAEADADYRREVCKLDALIADRLLYQRGAGLVQRAGLEGLSQN